jgi:YHS domain-containing protein
MELAKWPRRDGSQVDMGESVRLERDPVCGMMVDERAHQLVHHGVGYAFCSRQCRERFGCAPGLYVGRHGLLAPRQRGMEVIKRRRMVLASPLTQPRFAELKGALLSMMGVMSVRAVARMDDEGRDPLRVVDDTPLTSCIEAVEVSYDLLQATAQQLEHKIVELNATLRNGWGEKLQRDFIHYLEKYELDDLEVRARARAESDRRTRRTAPGFQGGGRSRTSHGGRDAG